MKTNSRIGSYFVIAVALGALSVLVNIVSYLCQVTSRWDFNFDALLRGNILHLLFIDKFWASYTSFPIAPWAMVHLPTGIVALGIAALCVWLVRVRLGKSWLLAGLACLSAGVFIYAKSCLIFWLFYVPEEMASAHISSMTLGPIYSLLACIACACMGIFRPSEHGASKTAWVPSPQTTNVLGTLTG